MLFLVASKADALEPGYAQTMFQDLRDLVNTINSSGQFNRRALAFTGSIGEIPRHNRNRVLRFAQ